MPEEKPVQEEVVKVEEKKKAGNKTPILVLGLLLITGILVYLALSPQRSKNGNPASNLPPQAQAQTKLNFSSAPILTTETSSGSAIYEVDVNIASGQNAVTGVQLEVNYDPKTLNVLSVTPGSFFTQPVEIQNKIDGANGHLSYVSATPLGEAGVSGQGVVAKIKFVKPATSGPITFSFNDQTVVTTEATSQNVLKESVDSTYTLENTTPKK